MKLTYKLLTDASGTPIAVNRSDGWSIPFDPDNRDYQLYIRWMAEGNTPEPAEQPVGDTNGTN